MCSSCQQLVYAALGVVDCVAKQWDTTVISHELLSFCLLPLLFQEHEMNCSTAACRHLASRWVGASHWVGAGHTE